MDWLSLKQKGRSLVKSYGHVLLILVAGLILMTLPGKKTEQKQAAANPVQTQPSGQENLEDSLGELLSLIQGAGKVKVLLTLEQGERILYQTDEDQSGDSWQSTTVILTDSEKNQYGLIRQSYSPEYRGAVVLCQGADSAAVRLALIEAVSNATGLSSDKISVLKMK